MRFQLQMTSVMRICFMQIFTRLKKTRAKSPMFSIIFWGSGEIFYCFFRSFSGKHRQETSGKNHRKNPGTRKLDAKHSAKDCSFEFAIENWLKLAFMPYQIVCFCWRSFTETTTVGNQFSLVSFPQTLSCYCCWLAAHERLDSEEESFVCTYGSFSSLQTMKNVPT